PVEIHGFPSLMKLAVRVLCACVALAAAAPAFAQKPVQLMVDGARGSAPDVMARTLAPSLAARLGEVRLENRAGGDAVRKAEPDGKTLLVSSDRLVLEQALAPRGKLDVRGDYTPIVLAGTVDFFL